MITKMENLVVSFLNEIGRHSVLMENFSLEIGSSSGEGISTLLIPMGGGKSTLARVLSGYLLPEKGAVKYDATQNAAVKISQISYGDSLSNLSLEDIYNSVFHDTKNIGSKEFLNEVAVRVGLEGYEKHIPSVKSKGYQFRLLMALAYFRKANLIILDIPYIKSSGVLQDQITGLIEEVSKEKKIILLTSSIPLSAELSQEIFLLSGTPLKLIRHFNEIPLIKDNKVSLVDEIVSEISRISNNQYTNYLL